MEEDILNYLPTFMFRGTPCKIHNKQTKDIILALLAASSVSAILVVISFNRKRIVSNRKQQNPGFPEVE